MVERLFSRLVDNSTCAGAVSSLPNISAAQIQWVVKQVAAYIDRQRQFDRAVDAEGSQPAAVKAEVPRRMLGREKGRSTLRLLAGFAASSNLSI